MCWELGDRMTSNADISEKYLKWIVRITADCKNYYTLAGIDKSDPDIDKVLVDNDNKLLLFDRITQLMAYIKRGENLFDRTNTLKWVKALQPPFRSTSSFDFDLLKKKKLSISDNKYLEDLVTTIYLITDLAHQTQNKKLLNITSSLQVENLLDYHANRCIWERDEKAIKSSFKKIQ